MADYAMRDRSSPPPRDSLEAPGSSRAAALNSRSATRETAQRAVVLNAGLSASANRVVQRVATFKFDQALTLDAAVDLAIAAEVMDAARRQDAIDNLNALDDDDGEFKTKKALFAYLSNRFAQADSDEDEEETHEGESSSSDSDTDEEAIARENADFGKEDRTQDRRVGTGRKRDTGTGLFKTDHKFREWVHGLKQKNQLTKYGVRNRTGGADNIDKSDLKILEAAYLKEKGL